MSNQAKKISRQELYERVWKTTLTQMAQELGITYVELAQACETLDVPRPGAGYWQRLKLNLPVEIIPLPEPTAATKLEIVVERKERRKAEVSDVHDGGTSVANTSTQQKSTSDQAGSTVAPESQPNNGPTPPIPKAVPDQRINYTRTELYEAIWTTPCQTLAASLGLSDVGLAKICKRLGIPRPSLGYWAKIAVGEKIPRAPLPPAQPGQDKVLTFDVPANLRRRKEFSEAGRSQKEQEQLAVPLELPNREGISNPLALKHRQALEKIKAGEDGMIRIKRRDLFQCSVSPKNIQRLCGALDALICELEARGYRFNPWRDEFGTLSITKANDSLSIRCSEGCEEIQREPTKVDRRKPSWTWTLKETRLTGKLSFEIYAPYLRGRRTWTEAENRPLPEILGIVVEKVEATFRGFEEQRKHELELAKQREEQEKRRAAMEVEEAKRRVEEEKRRQEAERLRRHEMKLAEIAEERRDNLLTATQQWLDSESVRAFIDLCERQWRQTGSGELSPVQIDWLQWAKNEAGKMLPSAKGYPDPVTDGRFDASAIPVGGPYPKNRKLDDEKPLEPAPPPLQVKTVYVESPQQFPYWALHRNR